MRIQVLQHIEFEGPANILEWAEERGHALAVTHLYAGEPLPALNEFDFLVIMGGPMNIYEYDRHPWLTSEKELIRASVDGSKIVLGVCLGAQLIADALGGGVYPNEHKEIGWLPVRLTSAAAESPVFTGWPREFTAFHWHGDTFDLPPVARHIALSEGCKNQAFAVGDRVVGLQFHIESTWDSVEALLANGAEDIVPGP